MIVLEKKFNVDTGTGTGYLTVLRYVAGRIPLLTVV